MAKTNVGLVAYAKGQIGRPYWFGTFGQKASASLYSSKKKQYPNYYTADDFKSQYGKKVHDCGGLIKGYLMSDGGVDDIPKYNSKYDVTADTMLAQCKEKGTIGSIPEIAGVLVFKKGHVGIYLGGGKVIEARSHKMGVVQDTLKDQPWTHWGKHKDIEYIVEAKPVEEKPVVTPDKYMIVTAYWLNMRSTPKIANNIMCEIKGGTKLKVLGKDGSWYKIQYNGKVGYCSDKYLKDA